MKIFKDKPEMQNIPTRQALEDKFYNGRDRSNSQMYKMAGNSIVVDVLECILKNLIN